MGISEEKTAKAQTVQEWATRLAGLDDFLDVVNARGFGYAQVNEPTDADLVAQGIAQDDYRNGISLLSAVRDLLEGRAVAAADRRGVVNRLRTDV